MIDHMVMIDHIKFSFKLKNVFKSVFSFKLNFILYSLMVPEPVALEDRKAFIHIAINLANILDADNLMVIQYFSLLIQKFQLNIEGKLLWDLFSFGAEFEASRIEYSELYTKQNILCNDNAHLK